MEKNKVNKMVTIIIIVALIIMVLWFIIIYPLIRFNANENTMLNAAKRYYEVNYAQLPKEGEIRTVSLRTLLDQKYITDLRTAYHRGTCSGKDSWVKVKKENGKYQYYTYLKCGIISSIVDHQGPVITLNGNPTMNVEKDSIFKDPGIKSVEDRTDGTMDVKDVSVKSDVDTSKIGTYTITYTIADSFSNVSTVTRKVIVSQGLAKTVEQATNKKNVYQGTNVSNYIRFSGQLFRIVRANSDGTVVIVSDESISQVDYQSLNQWLNDYYYSHLADSSKEYLADSTTWCSDTVKAGEVDQKNACKEEKTKQNVGLLSINDYNSSLKEGESYLYTNTINWTASKKDSKTAWTVKNDFFDQDSHYLDYSVSYPFNVRPALVLKKGVQIQSGDGSLEHPYEIGDFTKAKGGVKTTTRYSGEYVIYGSTLYRIVEANVDGSTKVISVHNLVNDSIPYGTETEYHPEKAGTVGYYIENNVSKYAKTGIFMKHEIRVPIYTKRATYTAKKTEKKYQVKFAAPSMFEMYSSYFDSFWYIESSKDSTIRYLSSDNGTVYYTMDGVAEQLAHLRFVGFLKKSSVIVSGSGTKTDPYKLSY